MKHRSLASMLAVSLLAGLYAGCPLQAAVTLNSTTYSQNFDGLNVGVGVISGVVGTINVLPGDTGWEGTRVAGTSNASTDFAVSSGDVANGRLAAFADTVNGVERALGAFASDGRTMAFGVALVNNTGHVIDKPTLKFDREQWRSSQSVVERLTFAYGLASAAVTSQNYLTAGLLGNSGFDLVGTAPVPSPNNGPITGNSDRAKVTIQGTLNVTVPIGATLFLRWTDTNDLGSDGVVAIDNFSLTFTPATAVVPIPEPVSAAFFGLAGLAVALRRRKRDVRPMVESRS